MKKESKDKLKKIKKILLKVKCFKERGCTVVKEDLKQQWICFVDEYLKEKNKLLYNSTIVEAAIICMESLSKGLDVEEVYEAINTKNDGENNPCLNVWQNYYVANIVSIFHERGKEFKNYRSKHIQEVEDPKKNYC